VAAESHFRLLEGGSIARSPRFDTERVQTVANVACCGSVPGRRRIMRTREDTSRQVRKVRRQSVEKTADGRCRCRGRRACSENGGGAGTAGPVTMYFSLIGGEWMELNLLP